MEKLARYVIRTSFSQKRMTYVSEKVVYLVFGYEQLFDKTLRCTKVRLIINREASL
jgi:hypothetical protein